MTTVLLREFAGGDTGNPAFDLFLLADGAVSELDSLPQPQPDLVFQVKHGLEWDMSGFVLDHAPSYEVDYATATKLLA